jgi:colanic acid/amylovoran biosynthesis glycosyltransferase
MNPRSAPVPRFDADSSIGECANHIRGAKIAYLVSRFPHLSETFILREMDYLRKRGWQISLYPLIVQRQPVMHEESARWMATLRRPPAFSPGAVALHPRGVAASLTLLGTCAWENRSSAKFLMRSVYLFPKALRMACRMQEEKIQHIHAHYATHPALVAWIIHRITGIPYSVTVHAHDIFVCTAMLSAKMRDAAFVVAISEFNREYLARAVGPWVREKVHVIRCGIEPERYPVRARPRAGGRFEIISVGSLQPYKGYPHLLEACARLRDQGRDVHCRVIGGGSDRRALARNIARLGLQRHVDLMGPQPQAEVARLLPTADCYVQPSIVTSSGKMEGIPVAIMEAMVCGLPVVATAISGIPELVAHRVTGYLVPPADAAALAAALDSVRADAAAADRLGAAGRERVLRDYSLDTNVERLAARFAEITKDAA